MLLFLAEQKCTTSSAVYVLHVLHKTIDVHSRSYKYESPFRVSPSNFILGGGGGGEAHGSRGHKATARGG